MLSQERARSSTIARALQPGVARTMRRVSTSAIKTIVEHNRLIDRTPLTTPWVAPERSSLQAAKTARAASNNLPDGRPSPFRSSASRESWVEGRAMGFQSHAVLLAIRDCSWWFGFFPNPISSDTFCRKPAPAQEWRPCTAKVLIFNEELHGPAGQTSLAQDLP